MAYWQPSRRQMLGLAATLAAARSMPAAAALLPTPKQTTGPFYPLDLPLDSDNDLVHVAGRSEHAAGTILNLAGRVLDIEGRPVPGARVEIWQCDAFGIYGHPRENRGPADPNFQGFGRTVAGDDGAYRFLTIVPVPYPGRTPHIHFKIGGPDLEPLATQMYIEGHPQNADDFIYRRLGSKARDAVTVELEPAPDLEPQGKSGARQAMFDIVLGTDGIFER